MAFDSLESMAAVVFEGLRPVDYISVTEAAKKYVMIRQPGAHVGPWSAEKTPYNVEIQDTYTSLDHTAVIDVGPARTGKSQKFLNWAAHTVKIDPTDMMLVHMAQHTAREWSKDDLEKFHRNSLEIGALLKPGRQNDNTYDKEYINGMRLEITWPTVKNLSGKTRRFVWLMDYDRMPDSIEGEGNAFDLGRKRTTTFKRFGMTVAESSPGREVENPKWLAKTPHEAPPTKGILELYNRGDRRRWYWECPHCHESFEPSFKLLQWPKCDDPMESAEQVTLVCPNNGCVMEPAQKEELNLGGRWVKDGMIWLPERGEIVERPGMKAARSDIASFWLKGPAAGFQTWQSIVLEYLRAQAAYDATGDEEPLRKTVNTDQGDPYTPKARVSERLPEDLKAKAEDWGNGRDEGHPVEPLVPPGVRFLLATIDVQARSFVVQVHGFAAGGDIVVVDAFKIRKSKRLDGADDPLPLDPGAYGEDWDLLAEEVMLKSYPLADGSGRRMSIKATGCDSGGREGVTHQAYEFWRRLRDAREGDDLPVGQHRRFLLIKGDGSLNAPRAVVTWPDSNRRDKLSTARGDVPVVRLNVNQLKDQVSNMLGRRVAEAEADTGGGMIRYPAWMPDWFFTQTTTEIRTEKGWVNPLNRRNEAWDLLVYVLGMALRPDDVATRAPLAVIRYDRLDWFGENCPGWAAEWDCNDLVFDPTKAKETAKKGSGLSFAELGARLT